MDAYLNLSVFPDVRPGLEALKKLGVRVAILSNGEPKMLDAAAKSAGISTLLDGVLSANDVKIFKPSPAVYKLVSKRMRVGTSDTGFVSANSWDVHGAASAGLITFWIQRAAGEPPEELGSTQTRVVGAVSDLVAFVRG
jgi:2-haloacid dehalogenase